MHEAESLTTTRPAPERRGALVSFGWPMPFVGAFGGALAVMQLFPSAAQRRE